MRRSGRTYIAALGVGVLVAAIAVTAYVLTPRTEGVNGDWSARSVGGTVVAGRALVAGGNTALDLRTGTRVTLGSVTGGTPYIADERLVIAGPGRLDSVRLDASARWTWRAPAGTTPVPLAASAGTTMVATCPATGAHARCRLVGLDAKGHQAWQSTGAVLVGKAPAAGSSGSPGASTAPASPAGGLPRAHAEPVEGGGLLVTDPVTGRQVLLPGSTFLAVPDGPVVLFVVQDGQCVVSATTGAEPVWTRVLGPCPGGRLPHLSVAVGSVRLDWPGKSRALDLATGKDTAATPPPGRGELARASGLVATHRDLPVRTDPLHWGDTLHAIELRTARSSPDADPVARIVSSHPLDLLLLEPRAVVVRDGDQVVRYTLDRTSATLEP